ncbi:tetratricopeptide repeat protein [Micromonospora sp. M12]
MDALVDRGGAVVISGTAGVGKTALAVHWAHRAAAHFPDGQLYVNLRGFDPAATPTEPARALHGFLEALGVPAARMPSDPDAMTSLYRTTVAGKRLLVVLDNARDAEQVRPLLPGSPDCLAIVTSRDQLVPLVVTESAQPVILDLLSAGEARDMLVRRLGRPGRRRVGGGRRHRRPVRAVTHRPGHRRGQGSHQPALLVGRGRRRAGRSGRLPRRRRGHRRPGGLLLVVPDARSTGGPAVPAAEPASRPGRLRPGRSQPGRRRPARDRPLLTELTRANLFTEHRYGRYAFHDLLRAYAAGLAEEAEPPTDRRAAVHRLLDHCLHTAHAADLALHPHFSTISLPRPQVGVTPESPRSRSAATAWFTVEVPVLLAAVSLAARFGFEGHAWRLAWTMSGFLHRQGHWQDWLGTQRIALAAASRIGDRTGQAHAHRSLGLACSRLRRYDEADDHLRRALDLFTDVGDDAGRAHTYLNRGQLAERQGSTRRHSTIPGGRSPCFAGVETGPGRAAPSTLSVGRRRCSATTTVPSRRAARR